MSYTLGEAAKAVGKSKGTISKAIKTGKISAHKKEDGSFSIEAAELHRVYPPVSETVSNEHKETPDEHLVNTKKDNELIELRVKLEAANTRINDLEKDKEEWREQARVLALAPPNQSKKSWLGRLFGS
jgi:protein subunit release factor A